jgi:hypothetical protein
MNLKDAVGILFIATGTAFATLGYRILGMRWYVFAFGLLLVGVLLIWSAARDRKIRDELDDVAGDWGDRHYISGSHATDDVDISVDD